MQRRKSGLAGLLGRGITLLRIEQSAISVELESMTKEVTFCR
jgi:hypothetical protein